MIDYHLVTSYHESAHAVAALVLGDPVYSLVAREDGSGGFRSHRPVAGIALEKQQSVLDSICDGWRKDGGPKDHEWLKRKIVGALAGPQASYRLLGDTPGCEHDFAYARSLISTLSTFSEDQRDRLYDRCGKVADEIVERHWYEIECLAARLYCEGELFEPEILDTLRHSGPRGRALIGEESVCN